MSYLYLLSQYLRMTTAINHLAVVMTNEVGQKAILEGVLKQRIIEMLLIGGFIENEESPGIVAAVIRENSVIRNLSISIRGDPAVGRFRFTAAGSLDSLKTTHWKKSAVRVRTFIRALPNEENLKVHINAELDHRQLQPIYAEI